jgi:outer membrane immunogenic protein
MLKAHCGAMILALAATTASAADLPLKAPPAAPPIQFSWTGCYVGGHLGGAVSQDTTTGVTGNSHNFGSTGFVGGGQIGCDYQFASGWVIGAEGRPERMDRRCRRRMGVRAALVGQCRI